MPCLSERTSSSVRLLRWEGCRPCRVDGENPSTPPPAPPRIFLRETSGYECDDEHAVMRVALGCARCCHRAIDGCVESASSSKDIARMAVAAALQAAARVSLVAIDVRTRRGTLLRRRPPGARAHAAVRGRGVLRDKRHPVCASCEACATLPIERSVYFCMASSGGVGASGACVSATRRGATTWVRAK